MGALGSGNEVSRDAPRQVKPIGMEHTLLLLAAVLLGGLASGGSFLRHVDLIWSESRSRD